MSIMDEPIQHAAEYRVWVEAMHEALSSHDMQAFGAALAGFNERAEFNRHDQRAQSHRRPAGGAGAFRCDSRLVDLAERQVPDARHRLAHVLKLTDDAAHHTMDLVDQSCPLVDTIAREARKAAVAAQAPARSR
jgi:chemotaxis protein CheZ